MQRDNKPDGNNLCRLIPKNQGTSYSPERDDRTQPKAHPAAMERTGMRGTKWRGEQKATDYIGCWKNSFPYGCRTEALRS